MLRDTLRGGGQSNLVLYTLHTVYVVGEFGGQVRFGCVAGNVINLFAYRLRLFRGLCHGHLIIYVFHPFDILGMFSRQFPWYSLLGKLLSTRLSVFLLHPTDFIDGSLFIAGEL
jgi:hypothetical protein